MFAILGVIIVILGYEVYVKQRDIGDYNDGICSKCGNQLALEFDHLRMTEYRCKECCRYVYVEKDDEVVKQKIEEVRARIDESKKNKNKSSNS